MILSTIPENSDMLQQLLDVQPCGFLPSIPHLVSGRCISLLASSIGSVWRGSERGVIHPKILFKTIITDSAQWSNSLFASVGVPVRVFYQL